jgi:hypothetical protein
MQGQVMLDDTRHCSEFFFQNKHQAMSGIAMQCQAILDNEKFYAGNAKQC